MMGGGTKLHYLPENAIKHANFWSFHVAKYVDAWV